MYHWRSNVYFITGREWRCFDCSTRFPYVESCIICLTLLVKLIPFLPFLLKPPLISSLPPLSDTNFLFMIHFHNKKQQTQNSTWGSSSGTTQEQRLSSHSATRTPVSPVSQGHLGSKVHSMWICETHHPKWWIVWHYSLMTIIIDICATAIQCTVTFKSTVYFEMGKSRNLNRFHPQNQQKKNILTTKVTYRLWHFALLPPIDKGLVSENKWYKGRDWSSKPWSPQLKGTIGERKFDLSNPAFLPSHLIL